MPLIKTSTVTYQINVPEADVRQALIMEAAERHGLTHEGKLIKGVEGRVHYDGRRGAGTYLVSLIRNIEASDQPRLAAPKGE